mgnify:CR=1 FL=1
MHVALEQVEQHLGSKIRVTATIAAVACRNPIVFGIIRQLQVCKRTLTSMKTTPVTMFRRLADR